MSTGLWILTAWLTAIAGFLGGCWWVGRSVLELRMANRVLGRTIEAQEEHIKKLKRELASDPRHAVCRRERRDLEEYIDYLEAGGDVVTEAENLLREPGT